VHHATPEERKPANLREGESCVIRQVVWRSEPTNWSHLRPPAITFVHLLAIRNMASESFTHGICFANGRAENGALLLLQHGLGALGIAGDGHTVPIMRCVLMILSFFVDIFYNFVTLLWMTSHMKLVTFDYVLLWLTIFKQCLLN
jgi:hypothetical protein